MRCKNAKVEVEEEEARIKMSRFEVSQRRKDSFGRRQ